MKWSWKIGEVTGISVYVHATFMLLIGWVLLTHSMRGHSLATTVAGIAFVLALFACVVAHEFGHALAARKYGIKTKDITLLPIGGLARLERMPKEPHQEFWVAVAGPAVKVVIAAALFAGLKVTSVWEPLGQLTVTSGSFVERLMVANLFLVGFNLIPAFPMDGGRVLRALLARRMDFTRATRIAAAVGQGSALVFGFVGLFGNPFLLFIALSVWIGASQEAAAVQMKTSVSGVPVSHAMVTDFQTLSPADSLRTAMELVLRGSQADFPVLGRGRLTGVLTRGDLLSNLASHGPEIAVEGVVHRHFEVVQSTLMLEDAVVRLHETEHHVLPVMDGTRLVGLLTAENLAEFLMIRGAMEEARRELPRHGSGLRAAASEFP